MQTFLPYDNFTRCAEVLDNKRLGKQRVETLQILNALVRPDYGWQNHPAVKMWRGHFNALLMYQVAVCREWTLRGYKDTCLEKSHALADQYADVIDTTLAPPAWIGNFAIHRSHRSNLLRKDPIFYAPKFEHELPDDLPYVWPV